MSRHRRSETSARHFVARISLKVSTRRPASSCVDFLSFYFNHRCVWLVWYIVVLITVVRDIPPILGCSHCTSGKLFFFYFSPLLICCLFVTGHSVILLLLVFYLFSLGGPRGAASSPRWLLARGQRPSELPSQLRPSVPPLSVTARRLLGCWRSHIDLLPLARTLSEELPFWPGYHLFGTHLATPTSWPSLKCIAQRQNKWTVSKMCQPWCFFLVGLAKGTVC